MALLQEIVTVMEAVTLWPDLSQEGRIYSSSCQTILSCQLPRKQLSPRISSPLFSRSLQPGKVECEHMQASPPFPFRRWAGPLLWRHRPNVSLCPFQCPGPFPCAVFISRDPRKPPGCYSSYQSASRGTWPERWAFIRNIRYLIFVFETAFYKAISISEF